MQISPHATQCILVVRLPAHLLHGNCLLLRALVAVDLSREVPGGAIRAVDGGLCQVRNTRVTDVEEVSAGSVAVLVAVFQLAVFITSTNFHIGPALT
jgi:hypothetical protein